VQWLEGSAPSAVPGHRRGRLLIDSVAGRINLFVLAGPDADRAEDVQIKETADALEINVTGQRLADYRFNTRDPEVRRPYFHPIFGPHGQPITQMGEVPGKKEKHFHHTALYLAHQNWSVPGQAGLDNWQMNKNCTRIEHVKFDLVESGPLAARFVERLHWLDKAGSKALVAETRTVTIPKRPPTSRVIDIDLTLKALDLPVTLNKTPYHLIACRVLDAMLPKNGGAISNSAGQKNPGDGALANWIDISGALDGKVQGVALLNHPGNDRQPTPCLQFAGQTIGLSPTHKEPLTIDAGKGMRFRCRVLVHAGNAEEGKVTAEYDSYTQDGKSDLGRLRWQGA
jgi:hypothetical protein